MEFETLTLERDGNLAILTFNRPDKLNAMNRQLFSELRSALEEVANDSEVRTVLIAAAGRAFSSGLDITEFSQLAGMDTFGVKRFIRELQEIFELIDEMEKPVVAAIHNMCFGAAMEMSLTCDIRVAAEDAVFSLLEVRYGIIPDLGGCKKLTALVGPGNAKRLIYTADKIAADEAYRIGMVEYLYPVETMLAEARALAKRLSEGPPVTIGLAKKVINRSQYLTPEESFEIDQMAQLLCLASEDFKEAVMAFLQKRPPEYKGR